MTQRCETWIWDESEHRSPEGVPDEVVDALVARLSGESLATSDSDVREPLVRDALQTLSHPALRYRLGRVIALAYRVALLPTAFPGPKPTRRPPVEADVVGVSGRKGGRVSGPGFDAGRSTVGVARIGLQTLAFLPRVSERSSGPEPNGWRHYPVGAVVEPCTGEGDWPRIGDARIQDANSIGMERP